MGLLQRRGPASYFACSDFPLCYRIHEPASFSLHYVSLPWNCGILILYGVVTLRQYRMSDSAMGYFVTHYVNAKYKVTSHFHFPTFIFLQQFPTILLTSKAQLSTSNQRKHPSHRESFPQVNHQTLDYHQQHVFNRQHQPRQLRQPPHGRSLQHCQARRPGEPPGRLREHGS